MKLRTVCNTVSHILDTNVFDQKTHTYTTHSHALSQLVIHTTGSSKCLVVLLGLGWRLFYISKAPLIFSSLFSHTASLSIPHLSILHLILLVILPPHTHTQHYHTWRDSVGEQVMRLLWHMHTRSFTNEHTYICSHTELLMNEQCSDPCIFTSLAEKKCKSEKNKFQ